MRDSENLSSAGTPRDASKNGAPSKARFDNAERTRRSGLTGPRTTLGKERSKRNALKHGIFSSAALLEGEHRAEFDAIRNGLRENVQPKGTLEEMLVEKLALFAWRYRRVLTAETAEIQRAIKSVAWEVEQLADGATKNSEHRIPYEAGLIQRISNPEVLERCLELLKELRDTIEDDGFDVESASEILTKLYGLFSRDKWKQTLFDSYLVWSSTAHCSEEERQQHGYATPKQCKKIILEEIEGEIKRLERYRSAHASMECEKRKLEVFRQHVPRTSEFDHLLRYEASLERGFDRTLTQLERLQRLRLGQPVLPKLEVNHSSS
jgi:hypothetical protein